jgi:hypothetical protein
MEFTEKGRDAEYETTWTCDGARGGEVECRLESPPLVFRSPRHTDTGSGSAVQTGNN